MTYSRSNQAEDQQEAYQKVKQITAVCEQLSIMLDPIDWQQWGKRAPVKVREIEIGRLLEFGQPSTDDILRRVRIKLLEHIALETVHARPGVKAQMWSPIDVALPQPFLSLWIITLETSERVPIIESIKDGQRVYEPYQFNRNDEGQLAALFGPASQGTSHRGEKITTREREREYTGEIIYSTVSGKPLTNRKFASRGEHGSVRTASTNEMALQYIVDCNDGFPHIVYQSQVIWETKDEESDLSPE